MRTCKWKGCSQPYWAKGFCHLHHSRNAKGIDMNQELHAKRRNYSRKAIMQLLTGLGINHDELELYIGELRRRNA